ncbi:MAG: DUF4861 family protein [Caulobacter sp.]
MKIRALTSLAALTVGLAFVQGASAQHAWYVQGDWSPVQRVAIKLVNDLDVDRKNNPVIITRQQLAGILPDLHELSYTVVDPTLEGRPQPSVAHLAVQGGHEIRAETNGRWIHYQFDDLDKDGLWDELFFMTDLKAKETRTVYIYLGHQDRGWNAHATHANIGSYMRHQAPFWESENVGWKLWYPTDIDVYGKRTPQLMSRRLYMENMDGYGVGQVDPGLGSDIMDVADSMGGGGIAMFDDPADPKAVSRPRFTPRHLGKTRFNAGAGADTRFAFEVVTNGPARSIIRIKTMNWDTGHGRYALSQEYTAYAGESFTTARVKIDQFDSKTPGAALGVGVRKRPNEKFLVQKGGTVITAAPEAIRNPDDRESFQTDLMVDYAGTALVVKDSAKATYVFSAERQGNHLFKMPRTSDDRYEYMLAAGWSEGAVLKTQEAFADYVAVKASEYNSPIRFGGAALESK